MKLLRPKNILCFTQVQGGLSAIIMASARAEMRVATSLDPGIASHARSFPYYWLQIQFFQSRARQRAGELLKGSAAARPCYVPRHACKGSCLGRDLQCEAESPLFCEGHCSGEKHHHVQEGMATARVLTVRD